MHKLKSRTVRVYGSTLCTITKRNLEEQHMGTFD